MLRALHERGAGAQLEIVALNDLADQASIEYLTRFDSTHGRFPGEVKVDGDCLHINGDCVKVLRQASPEGIETSRGASWARAKPGSRAAPSAIIKAFMSSVPSIALN